LYRNKIIGVVVPAYNEALFLGEVISTMPDFVDRIYLINDASSDNSEEVISAISDPRLMVLTHQKRSGAGAAMLTGYKQALIENMDVVAIMAGDGQMDPAILGLIIDPVVSGLADYSKGNRLSLSEHRRGMPKWRLMGNVILTFLIKVASGYHDLEDPLNGYTAISNKALGRLALDKIEKDYTFELDLLVKLNALGATVLNVPMPSRYRDEKSKITYFNFTVRMVSVLTKDYIWRIRQKTIRSNRSVNTNKKIRP